MLILIIEDDPSIRENTSEILELSGYDTIIERDGESGLNTAFVKLPDLILCDIKMPGMNGYKVLDCLMQNNLTKKIPFIFLTAKTENYEIEFGLKSGAIDYIQKPFSSEELLSAIQKILSKE